MMEEVSVKKCTKLETEFGGRKNEVLSHSHCGHYYYVIIIVVVIIFLEVFIMILLLITVDVGFLSTSAYNTQ